MNWIIQFEYEYFRCKVPGCDVEPYNFNQAWVSNAIPHRNGFPEKCTKYEQVLIPSDPSQCNNTHIFDTSQETCNDFIYETNELTLQNEVFALLPSFCINTY